MQCCGLCHQLSYSGKSALTACTVLCALSSHCPSHHFPPLLSSSLPPSHPLLLVLPLPPSPPLSCSVPTFFLAFSFYFYFLFSFCSHSSFVFPSPSSSLRFSMAWALGCIGIAHFYRLVTDFGGYHLDFTGYLACCNETENVFLADMYLFLLNRPVFILVTVVHAYYRYRINQTA